MKSLGKAAITFTCIFLACMIFGTVLIAAGGVSYLSSVGGVPGLIDRAKKYNISWDGHWEGTVELAHDIHFEQSLNLGGNVKIDSIKITNALPGDITVITGNDDTVSFSLDGDCPSVWVKTYDLNGKKIEWNLDTEAPSETDQPEDEDESVVDTDTEVGNDVIDESEIESETDRNETNDVYNRTGNSGPVSFTLSGGSMIIDINSPRGSFNSLNTRMTITLPKSFAGELQTQDIAGRLDINLTACDRIKISDMAGELKVSGAAKNLELSNMAGRISANLLGETEMIKIANAFNHATVDGNIAGFVISDCAADINITSGAVLKNDSKISDTAGQVVVKVGKGTVLNVDRSGTIGSVEINVDQSSSGTRLTVRNNVGRVAVDYK